VQVSAEAWRIEIANAEIACDDGGASKESVPEQRTMPRAVRIKGYGPESDFVRGDRIRFGADLALPEVFNNDQDARIALARQGIDLSGGLLFTERLSRSLAPRAWLDRVRAACRSRITASFPERSAALARALVLGDPVYDTTENDYFRRSGLAHLLAVSGMHLVLVILGAVKVLRWLLLRLTRLGAAHDLSRVCAWFGIPLSFLYADFAGASGSALRAAWMTSATLLALALGRKLHAIRALAISCLAMMCADPLEAFDLSFVLSFAATLGLILWNKPITNILKRARLPEFISAPMSGSLSSMRAGNGNAEPSATAACDRSQRGGHSCRRAVLSAAVSSAYCTLPVPAASRRGCAHSGRLAYVAALSCKVRQWLAFV
jgi:competence protein ComEC